MSRTNWKGPFMDAIDFKTPQPSKKAYVKSKIGRNVTILPKFIEQTFLVHTGQKFNEVYVTEEMIGQKFGEFVPTRKRFIFSQKKAKK